jgi:hypothetical protein
VADFCFISATILSDVLRELQEKGVEIIEKIVDRTGAREIQINLFS